MSLNPKIVIVIVSTIILALTLKQEFINAKKITLYKVFLFILLLLIVGYGIDDVLTTSIDSKQDKQDILDAINKKGANEEKQVQKSDTLQANQGDIGKSLNSTQALTSPKQLAKRIKYALLDFSVMGSTNPTLEKTDRIDSLEFKYMISNFGTGEAFNLKMITFCAEIVRGKIFLQKERIENSFNFSVSLYPSKSIGRPGRIPILFNKPFIDSTFFCFKMDFDDSTKKRKSFVKIYNLSVNHFLLSELDNDLYKKLESYIIKEKYWKPPFRQ